VAWSSNILLKIIKGGECMDKSAFISLLKEGNGASGNNIVWAEVLADLAKRTKPFTPKQVHEWTGKRRKEGGVRMKLNELARDGKLVKVRAGKAVFYLHPSQVPQDLRPTGNQPTTPGQAET